MLFDAGQGGNFGMGAYGNRGGQDRAASEDDAGSRYNVTNAQAA